jgi:asparagine synthase (glutamine-hydrolysing)
MSGICGLFNIDGAPVAGSDLRSMTAMLEQRGPERTGKWRDGQIGLGHTLLATTPELLFEEQPFAHKETGCVMTADVRLDNRIELSEALVLRKPLESTGDAEIILLAYLAWGEDCVNRLLGDFAFAIWDPRHQALFCARDHFGMRALYYHHAPGQRFVFASDARAILVVPQVPYRINEGRVADFLVPELEWYDYTSTFFEEVYRLPPGHRAIVTSSGINVTEYWRAQPGPELGQMSDDDYREGFVEVFSKAIGARLRAPEGKVGSMLSGGMDSGSIAAIATDVLANSGSGPLRTFSGTRKRGTNAIGEFDCTETRAIHAALSMLPVSPTLVHPDASSDTFEPLSSGFEEPFDGVFTILKAIFLAAHDQGRTSCG